MYILTEVQASAIRQHLSCLLQEGLETEKANLTEDFAKILSNIDEALAAQGCKGY